MYGFENFDNEYAFGTGMSSKEKEKEKEARHHGTGDMLWDQPKFWFVSETDQDQLQYRSV